MGKTIPHYKILDKLCRIVFILQSNKIISR